MTMRLADLHMMIDSVQEDHYGIDFKIVSNDDALTPVKVADVCYDEDNKIFYIVTGEK